MIKKSIFQILNGFRVVAFWIFAALLIISIKEAVRESGVNITVEDAVLGDKINEYAGIQEFTCVCNGKTITVSDTKGRKTGDKVQLIFRDGKYYALVNPEYPDNGVTLKDRVSYHFTMATGGNLIFTFIAYIFLLIFTFKSRKESRQEYPILFIITHICGLMSAVLFILWCFWLDFLNLIVYAVIFGCIWIIRVIIRSVSGKNKTIEVKEI
ncbi:MAG: hypothetical protein J6M65_00280 [Eubacterium sp.]|nr:hypothetical protein [Eubacterium sp.]